MITKARLRRLEDRVYDAESRLNHALSELAIAAEEILGYEVIADLCHGQEIEFHTLDRNGCPNDISTIRIEDIIRNIN